MSLAFKGQGAVLAVSGTTLGEVTKIQRSGVKADFADVTNMQSPGGYREVIPTLLDPGEVSFDCNYLGHQDPGQTNLQIQFDAQQLLVATLTLPPSPGGTGNNGTWTFNVYVSSVDFDLPIDKEAKLSAKLKITGKPVFA